jgi:TPR repeat protein
MYYYGANGLTPNYEVAKEYFEMAAAEDSPTAIGFLGIMYMNGQGVASDPAMALSYFRRGTTDVSHEYADMAFFHCWLFLA